MNRIAVKRVDFGHFLNLVSFILLSVRYFYKCKKKQKEKPFRGSAGPDPSGNITQEEEGKGSSLWLKSPAVLLNERTEDSPVATVQRSNGVCASG